MFGDAMTLRKFAAAYASIHNRFNQARSLGRRDIVMRHRAAALAVNSVAGP